MRRATPAISLNTAARNMHSLQEMKSPTANTAMISFSYRIKKRSNVQACREQHPPLAATTKKESRCWILRQETCIVCKKWRTPTTETAMVSETKGRRRQQWDKSQNKESESSRSSLNTRQTPFSYRIKESKSWRSQCHTTQATPLQKRWERAR